MLLLNLSSEMNLSLISSRLINIAGREPYSGVLIENKKRKRMGSVQTLREHKTL